MRILPAPASRWLRRMGIAAICVALTGIAWAAWLGYRAGDAQAALAALWSLCAPAR